MKLADAWRLSRLPYREVVYRSLAEERGRMWWGAFGRTQAGKEGHDDLELAKRALRIAKFDKIIVSVFNVVVSIVPFAASFFGAAVFGLASSVSLSLAVTFGFTALYAIQTLSSFVSAESSVLLSTLPIARNDFSLITLFSFVRSVDYMVLGSIFSQVVAVSYLTGSPAAALIMFVASAINQLFAVTIALGFSRIFQKNVVRGGRSKVTTILRLFYILIWGLLLVGVGFLFSVPWYIVPNLENALVGAGQLSSSLLGLLYPFSTGILIADMIHRNVAFVTALTASVALVGYTVLAFIAARWSLGVVKSISQGSGVKATRVTAVDFKVKTRGPLLGYIVKDLKVASRNPATAFFFALPVLETVITALLVSSSETLRTALVLDATLMGGIFALFLPLALLSAEGKGLEYTKTLPISSRKIVASKALVSTATYVPVPLAIVGLSLVKPLTSLSSVLIPFLIVLAVAPASVFEIKLFFRTAAQGKISAIVNDIEKLVVGVFAIVIPEFAYGVTFLASLGHSFALLVMGLTVGVEIGLAAFLLKRS